MTLLFTAGCAQNIVVSDRCVLDGLIYMYGDDVNPGSVTEGAIIAHNYRYELACSKKKP